MTLNVKGAAEASKSVLHMLLLMHIHKMTTNLVQNEYNKETANPPFAF